MNASLLRRTVARLALAAITAAAVWQGQRAASSPSLPPTPSQVPATIAEPANVPQVVAELPDTPVAALAADHARQVELPDGTFVAALNDAVDAAPIAQYWGQQPWSPIVAIERSSAGLEWFRHADGSYSTTQMVWRSDLGRHAAMTRVAHPGPQPAAAAPVAQSQPAER